MSVRHQLAVGGEALERRALEQRLVTLDAVEHGRLEHEEPAVHPGAVADRLLLEGSDARRHDPADDLVVFDIERSEAADRLDGRDRRELAVRTMELDQLRDVHVRRRRRRRPA